LKIGLSYFEAIEAVDDAAGFDVPLNFCITPQRTYVF
jgi:5-formyltetrahydrofolate cyclo-ligase